MSFVKILLFFLCCKKGDESMQQIRYIEKIEKTGEVKVLK